MKRAIALLVAASAGCSLTPNLDRYARVTVTPDLPKSGAARAPGSAYFLPFADSGKLHGLSQVLPLQAPATAANMNCLAVNVNGPGIVSAYSSSPSDPIPWDCLQLGAISPMVTTQSAESSGITISIPNGPARQFQVLGITTQSSSDCSGIQVADLLRSNAQSAIFDLGDSVVTNLFQDTEVTVTDQYDAAGTTTGPLAFAQGLAPDLMEACLQPTNPIVPDAFFGDVLFQVGATSNTINVNAPTTGVLPPVSNGQISMISCNDDSAACGQDSDFPFPLSYLSSTGNARIDLLYQTDGLPMTQYNYLTLQLLVDEGIENLDSGFNCAGSPSASGANGFQVALYSPQTGQWDTATQVTGQAAVDQENLVNPQLTTFTLNYPSFNAVLTGFPAFEQGDGGTTGTFLHFTIQSLDAGGTECSYLKIVDASLFLDRVLQSY